MTDIDRLIPKKRGQGRLQEAPERDALPPSVTEATPAAPSEEGGGGGGRISPEVEQTYTGSTYYTLTSSDGLFVLEFPDQTTVIDDDGAGTALVYKWLDPDA